MSDRSPNRPPLRHRVARGAALACSLGLGALVVVNAQVGCDAPVETPSEDAATPTAPAPPTAKAPSDAPAPVTAEANAPVAEPEPAPSPAAEAPSDATPTAIEPKKPPVMMPASKSGGDFGAMRFPGEASKTNAAQQPHQQAVPQQQAESQQQNPAPGT